MAAFAEFAAAPRAGEVYNLGGGRGNSASIIECINKIESLTGKKLDWTYSDQARSGDHICYISDLSKFQRHYPNWKITRQLDQIIEAMARSQH